MHLTPPNHATRTKAANQLKILHSKQRAVGKFPC
jgi:hypothetical protein